MFISFFFACYFMYLSQMINIVLIGSGNVAVQLAGAFSKSKKVAVLQRFSRSNANDGYFDKNIPVIHDLKELKQADIYIIAIADKSISDISKQLKFTQGLVVHTAGSMPLDALLCAANKGVLYPLQTFSKEQPIRFKNIPLALETEKKEDYKLLEALAKTLSAKIYPLDTGQRRKLHIAAVFANNFANHMFKIAKDICDENNFSFDILKPIILETANKMERMSPMEAQTGPARRNETHVIEKHVAELDPDKKEMYTLISRSIIKTYHP